MGDTSTIVLPDPDDMLRRLRRVSDDGYVVQHFYPILIKSAGRRTTGPGVVIMLVLAIADYRKISSPEKALAMMLRIEDFIRTLVDDQQIRDKALVRWQETQSLMQAGD